MEPCLAHRPLRLPAPPPPPTMQPPRQHGALGHTGHSTAPHLVRGARRVAIQHEVPKVGQLPQVYCLQLAPRLRGRVCEGMSEKTQVCQQQLGRQSRRQWQCTWVTREGRCAAPNPKPGPHTHRMGAQALVMGDAGFHLKRRCRFLDVKHLQWSWSKPMTHVACLWAPCYTNLSKVWGRVRYTWMERVRAHLSPAPASLGQRCLLYHSTGRKNVSCAEWTQGTQGTQGRALRC